MHTRFSTVAIAALLLSLPGCIVLVSPPADDNGNPPADGNNPPVGGQPIGLPAEDNIEILLHDRMIRRYFVHQPEGWDGVTPLPVVLNFHGGRSTPETQAGASQMNVLADEKDFMVVYPEGTGPGVERDNYTWNAGGCCGYAMENNVDDVGFVAALLDDLDAHYTIDRRRVYATGMSNGAMMAHRVGVELAERIAAVAPVAGSLMLENPPQPARPVPVMHFHGLLDENAPFNGGQSQNSLNPVEQNSIPETIAWWVQADGANPEPATTTFTDYIEERHEPLSAGGAPVVLIILPEGGHTWPGGVDVTADLNTGPLVESVDASGMMWDFFSGFALPE